MEFRLPEPRVEPSPRWVRVRVGGMWVADSTRALLLAWYGPGMLPTYCFPPDDVRTDLFEPSEGDPRGLVVEHDVRVGSAVFPRAAHLFRDPPPPLAGARRPLVVRLGRARLVVRGGPRGARARARPVETGRRAAQRAPRPGGAGR